VWGVLAMVAVLASALLAVFRRRLPPAFWRAAHTGLALVIVAGGVAHTLLIEGTMGLVSKWLLCGLVLLATAAAILRLRPFAGLWR
jgi:hypothetical protein